MSESADLSAEPTTVPSHASLTLARQSVPISLKALSVNAHGELARRRSVGPLHFTFVHAGRHYAGEFSERAGRARLSLVTLLTRLPPDDANRRRRLRAVVREARACDVRLIVRRDGRVELSHRQSLAAPVSAEALITALVTVIAQGEPWMALLEAV